jgi:hypothetical protein
VHLALGVFDRHALRNGPSNFRVERCEVVDVFLPPGTSVTTPCPGTTFASAGRKLRTRRIEARLLTCPPSRSQGMAGASAISALPVHIRLRGRNPGKEVAGRLYEPELLDLDRLSPKINRQVLAVGHEDVGRTRLDRTEASVDEVLRHEGNVLPKVRCNAVGRGLVLDDLLRRREVVVAVGVVAVVARVDDVPDWFVGDLADEAEDRRLCT